MIDKLLLKIKMIAITFVYSDRRFYSKIQHIKTTTSSGSRLSFCGWNENENILSHNEEKEVDVQLLRRR